jgi:hypothetical protein
MELRGPHCIICSVYKIGSGYPDPFKNALNNLLRGFFRVLTSRKSTAKQQIREQQLGGEIVTNANNVLSQWNQVSFFFLFFFTNFFVRKKGKNQ